MSSPMNLGQYQVDRHAALRRAATAIRRVNAWPPGVVPELRLAQVVSNDGGTPPTCTITTGGSATTEPGWKFAAGLNPAANDLVYVVSLGGNKWILARLAAAGWVDATLNANFSEQGAPYGNFGYLKDATGRVWLRGLIVMAGGRPASAVLTTLPTGFRPQTQKPYLIGCSDNVARRFDVLTNGQIQLFATGPAGGVSTFWDGVSFDTDA